MNSNLGTAVLVLKVDDKDFDKGLTGAEKKTSSLGSTLKGVGSIASGFLAAGAVTQGLSKLTDFAGGAIDAIKESKIVNAQLDAVLKSTGNTTGITAQGFRDMASALEKTSLFEDEAILGAENMLLTFTNIGGTVMPAATQTVLDMSQALGQDLKSSSVQLGKALNDPIAGISALSRVGVTFTEDQKAMIEGMVAAGDTIGAQQLILAELNKEFGGSAKAASDAAGASEIQKDKMNELNEVIGAKLLPIQEKFKQAQVAAISFIIDTVIPAIDKWIQKHPEIVEAMNSVVAFISEHWPQIQKVIEIVATQVGAKIDGMITTITGVIEVITSVVNTVDALFHGEWAAAWESFKEIPSGILKIFDGLLSSTLGTLADTLKKVGSDAIQGMWDGIKAKWDDMTGWVGKAADKLPGFIKGPLGIGSPSRVMREVGTNTMLGYLEGIKAQGKNVDDYLIEFMRTFKLAEDEAGDLLDSFQGRMISAMGTMTDAQAQIRLGFAGDNLRANSQNESPHKSGGSNDKLYKVTNPGGTGGGGGGVTASGGDSGGGSAPAAPEVKPLEYGSSLSEQSAYVKGSGITAAGQRFLTNPYAQQRINNQLGQAYFSVGAKPGMEALYNAWNSGSTGGAMATAWNGEVGGQQPIQVTVNGSILTERDVMSLFRDAAIQGGFRGVQVG